MQSKKSFDIIPPQKAKIDLPFFIPKLGEKPTKIGPKKKKKIFPFLVSSGIILAAFLSYFFIPPKAEIEIWPKMEEVSFQTQVVVWSSAGEIDLVKNQIPGFFLQAEESVSGEFPSSGSGEKKAKAEGVIRVYNNYHLEQILVQNTRFWCFEGDELREFKTKEKVVVPSNSYLDVEVVASASGEQYNIPPCTFSVPGLKGSPRYTAVYGESSSPMRGGEEAEVHQVTEADLEGAEASLTQRAFEKSEESLKNLISSGGYILVEGATVQKIIESDSLAEPGQETERFSYRVKSQARALVFKKSNLDDFAVSYIVSRIASGREVQTKSLQAEYSSSLVDLKGGKIALNLEMEANVFTAIKEAVLKETVKGKSPDLIKQGFEDYPEIDRAQVRFWPFWVQKAPEQAERIIIRMRVD